MTTEIRFKPYKGVSSNNLFKFKFDTAKGGFKPYKGVSSNTLLKRLMTSVNMFQTL